MFRKHEKLESEAMGRSMHLWRIGHFGSPILVFPSAAGMAHEWESNGMLEVLEDFIDAGRLKLYCTESNVAEAWTRKEDSKPEWRIQRHKAYEQFILNELTAYIREDCQTPDIPIAAAGTSLGAYYSANFALKQPAIFNWALCLSGRYDITWMTDGFNTREVYESNPMAYVQDLDGEHLEQIQRNTHLTLVCGQGRWEDGNIEDTHQFADLLAAKGISHQRDLWGHDVDHQWPWWQKQARYHIGNWIARTD